MSLAHRVLAGIFALLLDPLAGLPPALGLTVISVGGGVVALLAFRFTSDPRAIRRARQRAQAHLLAVRLYRDDVAVVMRAQGALLRALATYIGQMLVPFVVLLLPFSLLFAQLDARYGTRALHPGEHAIVKVTTAPDTNPLQLKANSGLIVETPPVKIPRSGEYLEVVWRIRAEATGCDQVAVVDGNERVEKQVCVAADDSSAAPRRDRAGLEALFTAPTEVPIESVAKIISIEINYPARAISIRGWHIHWIVIFLIVSTVTALLARKRLGVEF